MTPNVQCGTCDKNITKTQGSLHCHLCFEYYHASCANISLELLNFIAKTKGTLKFTCERCKVNPPGNQDDSVASLRNELREAVADIQIKFDTIRTEIKQELGCTLNEIKSDVENCYKTIESLDISTTKKIKALQDQNEILHKRLNRSDIVINGFKRYQDNILDIVLKIFNMLNVQISPTDIGLCCFINNGHSILVKFNSVSKRDLIMHNYFTNKSLDLTTVIKQDINKKIYLNDHLSATAGRMCYICRGLRRNKNIKKFRLLNTDVPKVKIILNNEETKIFDLAELEAFFKIPTTSDEQRNNMEDEHI